MFVVFEGIDGGGKTTLSSMVAAQLRARGLTVEHVREGGKFASGVTQAMRELGRDARNVAMTPRSELMLYLTREVQLFEEATRSALARADVVIADRFVYTAEVLAVHGRGLAADDIRPLVYAALDGYEPELAVLVDVDPSIARARRRVSKLLANEHRPPARKGLAGTGLQHRLRAGYLALAARDPRRWLVVDNTDADLHALAAALTALVADARESGVAAARDRMPRFAPAARDAVTDVPGARAALLSWIDRRAEREPTLAAYFLDGVPGDEFDERRRRLATLAPRVVADGLRYLLGDAAWRLRHELAAAAPEEIASSLAGPAGLHDDAPALLRRLVERAPRGVAAALRGRNDAVAWELREMLAPEHRMRSVGGVRHERATAIREQWLAERHTVDVMAAETACAGTAGVDDDLAWMIRRSMRDFAPVAAIEATLGLCDDRSWKWRRRYLENAPKSVMRSLEGIEDPRAWELREQCAATVQEAIDSFAGSDDARAWRLREAALATWPATAVKSLGPLAATDRGRELVAAALARHPCDLALWRQAVIVSAHTRSSCS